MTFQDGETTLGSITLVDGTATYTISTLTVGSHSITAVYSGDANFAGSTSSPLDLTVEDSGGIQLGSDRLDRRRRDCRAVLLAGDPSPQTQAFTTHRYNQSRHGRCL